MRNAMKRMTAMILAVLVLTAPGALADLERGDQGDDVAVLQQLLFECGWLFELPDGIFGGNTQEAVRNFEAYAGLPVDGIADDEMIYELAVSLRDLNNSNGVYSTFFGDDPVEYLFGEENSEDGGGAEFALFCSQFVALDGSTITNHCEKHHMLQIETYPMLECGEVEQAELASQLWLNEVNRLYEEWEQITPVEEKGGIIANRATFLASIEAQRAAAQKNKQTDAAKIKTEVGICANLRNQVVWLCEMIWQQAMGVHDPVDPSAEAVRLDALTIIEGDKLYYSGLLAGEAEEAIYVMNLDGSDCRKLANIDATLEAVSQGNLLIWAIEDDGEGMLKILRRDGSLENVSYYYNGCAVAEDGRFYYGGSSVDCTGYDHQWLLSSDPEYQEQYWPLYVADGYLYYKDQTGGENAEVWYGYIPEEATLNRLNLETGDIELISGPGTVVLGMDEEMIYYAVRDFSVIDDEGGFYTVDVENGVYAADLDTLETTLLDVETRDWDVNENYVFAENGVIYGDRSDENGDYSLIRVLQDGTELPMIPHGDQGIEMLDVVNDVLYGHATVWLDSEDGDEYLTEEYFLAYSFGNDEWNLIKLEADETIYYVGADFTAKVIGDRIYYYVLNTAEGKEYLKSIRTDGSDRQTILTTGYVYY